MTKDEIREMFLLNAEVRGLPPCDPRREQGEEILAGMTRRYAAEVPNAQPAPERKGPDWQKALAYVAEVFQRLDSCETDEGAVAFRRGVWETITDAVQVFYQSPELEPMRRKIAEMKKAAAQASVPQDGE